MHVLFASTKLLSSLPAPLLQHAPHFLSLLEPPPPLPWQHLPIPLPAAGLPLEDSGCSPIHAAPPHLAGPFLLLPLGDLWPHGLFPVSCAHVGVRAQPAIGLPRLDKPRLSHSWHKQERLSLLTVIARYRRCFPSSLTLRYILLSLSTAQASVFPAKQPLPFFLSSIRSHFTVHHSLSCF